MRAAVGGRAAAQLAVRMLCLHSHCCRRAAPTPLPPAASRPPWRAKPLISGARRAAGRGCAGSWRRHSTAGAPAPPAAAHTPRRRPSVQPATCTHPHTAARPLACACRAALPAYSPAPRCVAALPRRSAFSPLEGFMNQADYQSGAGRARQQGQQAAGAVRRWCGTVVASAAPAAFASGLNKRLPFPARSGGQQPPGLGPAVWPAGGAGHGAGGHWPGRPRAADLQRRGGCCFFFFKPRMLWVTYCCGLQAGVDGVQLPLPLPLVAMLALALVHA